MFKWNTTNIDMGRVVKRKIVHLEVVAILLANGLDTIYAYDRGIEQCTVLRVLTR